MSSVFLFVICSTVSLELKYKALGKSCIKVCIKTIFHSQSEFIPEVLLGRSSSVPFSDFSVSCKCSKITYDDMALFVTSCEPLQ